MKNKIPHYIIPVCIVVISILTLKKYLEVGEILYAQLCIIFVLIPSAIEGFKPNIGTNQNYKYFRILMIVLGISMLVIFGIQEM